MFGLVGYLAAGIRTLDRLLAVIIQTTSTAGKSLLMDAVLNLMPENERVQYSAMTGQSMFYISVAHIKAQVRSSINGNPVLVVGLQPQGTQGQYDLAQKMKSGRP